MMGAIKAFIHKRPGTRWSWAWVADETGKEGREEALRKSFLTRCRSSKKMQR